MEDITSNTQEQTLPNDLPAFKIFPFFNRKQAAFLICLIAVIFYSPSFNNEYALDDGILIHQNSYVLQGVKGIKHILTKDAYDSFYKRMNASDQLAGGRYRPIASISYALEQEIIGTYRTGQYLKVEDSNKNGLLDNEKVLYTNYGGKSEFNYEFNDFVDQNNDGIAQPSECYTCWDLNKNFENDPAEDLNADGVFNEIDCQVYGAELRHFNNIWLYALACLLLYILFSGYFFKNQQDLAFLAALIFTMHPANSEVVANIRGRDDLFSLIFISLTFIFAFKFVSSRHIAHFIICAIAFVLALMSKEYAMLLFILIPLALYIFEDVRFSMPTMALFSTLFLFTFVGMFYIDYHGLFIFESQWLTYLVIAGCYAVLNFIIFKSAMIEKKNSFLFVGLYTAGIFYLVVRLSSVVIKTGVPDTELLNNPYILATGAEAFATKIYALLIYLRIFFWPHPLVSDYSYATIAYREPSDMLFILSLTLHLAILIFGIILSARRHVLGFAMLVYFCFILVVSNLFFVTGIMMLESFLFHAAIGLSILVAWIMINGFEKMKNFSLAGKRAILICGLSLIVLLSGIKAWERSKDWKNDVTLFLKDVKNAPHSVLVLGNAGARWIDLADTKEITGVAYPGGNTKFNDYNGTLVITDEEMREGKFKDKREAALTKGINFLKHAVELHPRYVNGFLNLGLAHFKLQKEMECIYYWKYAEYLYPNNPYLNNYYQVYGNMLMNNGAKAFEEGDYKKSAREYTKKTIITPNDAEAWYQLSGVFFNLGRYKKAKACVEKAKALGKDDTETKEVSKVIDKGLGC